VMASMPSRNTRFNSGAPASVRSITALLAKAYIRGLVLFFVTGNDTVELSKHGLGQGKLRPFEHRLKAL
jgi:hypothetical protein